MKTSMPIWPCQRTAGPSLACAVAKSFWSTMWAAVRMDEAIRRWELGIAILRAWSCAGRSWLAVGEGRRLHSRRPSNRLLSCQGQLQRSVFMRFSCRETIIHPRLLQAKGQLTVGIGRHVPESIFGLPSGQRGCHFMQGRQGMKALWAQPRVSGRARPLRSNLEYAMEMAG